LQGVCWAVLPQALPVWLIAAVLSDLIGSHLDWSERPAAKIR
jgi:hypothetical protein